MQILAWVSFAVGWLRGGHIERRAVMVLFCDYAFTRLVEGTTGAHQFVAGSEFVVMMFFAWLAFRSERWWTFATLGALALCALVFVLERTTPNLALDAALSARLGLWLFIYATLLAGVAERRLAGESAISGAAVWRRRRGGPLNI